MKTSIKTTFLTVSLILTTPLSYADMYCKGNIISEGSSIADVMESCGSPTTSSGTLLGLDADIYQNKDGAGVNYEIRYGSDGRVQQINESKHW